MLNKRFLVSIFVVAFVTLIAGCIPTPTNQVPVITSIPITAVDVGETYTYDVNATDPDGDVLTYSLTVKPVLMTINSSTGKVIWFPKTKGNYAVVVKVSDGDLDITQSFTIVVSKPYTPPTPPPTPSAQLTSIVVEPKEMTLCVGEEEKIKSVTATYEIKGFEVLIALSACTYDLVDETVITVSNVGVVTAVAVGEATITVTYKGKKETIAVTVKELIVVQDSGQNTINKKSDHPYINWTIDCLCIEFEFVNPTIWTWAFDYRVDGEEGEITPWSDIIISGGELIGQEIGPSYNIVSFPAKEPGLTKTVHVCVEEEVWVGMRLGDENDYYLDWIKFEVR